MYFFFFFPVGTDSRPRHLPVGTFVILSLTVAAFLLRDFYPYIYETLVLSSYRPSHPTLGGAFLSLFLHASWPHLLGNALYVVIFGKQLEGRLGFLPLAIVYGVGGIAACYVQGWTTPIGAMNYDTPVVGASSAVAALLGASVVRFWFYRVRVLYFLFAFLGGMTRGGVVKVNTVLACLFWFLFQIIHGLVAWGNGGGGVAYAAHAGGFVAGMLLAVLLGFPAGVRRELHQVRGKRYFEKGDWFAANGELTTHLRYAPDDREVRAMRARCWLILGRTGEAAAEYLGLFRDARQSDDLDQVARLYREIRRYGLPTNLSEGGLFALAFRFRKEGLAREAAEAFQEVVERFPADAKAELALIRRAEILWEDIGATEEARDSYRYFLEQYPASDWHSLAAARLRSMDALAGGGWHHRRAPGVTGGTPTW